MAQNITKIIFRQGLESQRRAGIPFNSAEPAYAFDTKRLYIGDAEHLGGIPVGVRNLGAVSQLFGTYLNSGLSQEAYQIFTLSGCEVNDIIYDRTTRILYSLSARSSNTVPLSADLIKYDFTVLIDPVFFQFSPALGNQLTINDESIGVRQIPTSICAPGGGLFKTDKFSGIAISPNGITNTMLDTAPKYTVKGNPYGGVGNVIDIECAPSQFIGRSSTSQLTALPFSTLLADASIIGTNGVSVQTIGTTSYIQLSTSHFFTNAAPDKFNVRVPTTINNTLSVVDSYTSLGPLQCGAITSTSINTQNNNITMGTGTLNCNTINCGNIFASPNTVTCGPVVCTTINTQGNTITTTNGNINMGTGDLTCDVITYGSLGGGAITCTTINTQGNTITTNNGSLVMGTGSIGCGAINGAIITGTELRSTGDITAYYSDRRLKENIQPIDNALDKICRLKGVTYTPNAKAKEFGFDTTQRNVGLFAQDVEEVLPEAIRIAPFDADENGDSKSGENYKTIQYEKVIPLLVEGIKELQDRIVYLENELQQLRK